MTETHPATATRSATAPHRGARRHAPAWLILLVIAGAQMMVVLDGTIVNIALPSIGRAFNKNQTDLTWVLNAYALAFGGLLLVGGRSGDILGRRRMFVIGLGMFTVGSFLGGVADGVLERGATPAQRSAGLGLRLDAHRCQTPPARCP